MVLFLLFKGLLFKLVDHCRASYWAEPVWFENLGYFWQADIFLIQWSSILKSIFYSSQLSSYPILSFFIKFSKLLILLKWFIFVYLPEFVPPPTHVVPPLVLSIEISSHFMSVFPPLDFKNEKTVESKGLIN